MRGIALPLLLLEVGHRDEGEAPLDWLSCAECLALILSERCAEALRTDTASTTKPRNGLGIGELLADDAGDLFAACEGTYADSLPVTDVPRMGAVTVEGAADVAF